MKGCPASRAVTWCVTVVGTFWLLIAAAPAFAQTPSADPRITRVTKDVKLVTRGSTRPAAVNDRLADGIVLQTGSDARAEIALFNGRALARLGGRTAVRSRNQAHDLELQEGAVLFQVPKAVWGARITTAGINVATTGTTGIIERYGSAYVKILVLEGTARVYLNKVGESVLVNPGQMLITRPSAATLPEPVHFEIAQLLKTSLLTGQDFGPLASNARIEEEIRKQRSDPDFTPTNLVIYGRGTLVTLVPPSPAPAASPKPGGRATPTAPPARRRRD